MHGGCAETELARWPWRILAREVARPRARTDEQHVAIPHDASDLQSGAFFLFPDLFSGEFVPMETVGGQSGREINAHPNPRPINPV